MAVVKLGKPVKSNLDGDNGAMAYIIKPAKTDNGRLVSSNYERTGTDWDALAEPMLRDNEDSPKGILENSRLAYHIKLSFSPDDPVTPEKVHQLGMEFARRITGDEYRFVVATHTDRHHLHDHIMVCAAARYGDHLKAHLPKDAIEQWRVVANEICAREGLNVIFNPVTERVARKMRDDGIARKGDGSTPERGPETAAGTPAPSQTTPGSEPLGRRYGMPMEEIYASAKGKGTKDRLRILIDLDAARTSSIGELAGLLDSHGITLILRGGSVTFIDRATGRKFRGSRLGEAYSLDAIGARLMDGGSMLHLTFNNKLVAAVNDRTISVWLPGTKRRRKVNLPVGMLRRDGSTWHLLMPETFTGMVMDRANRYAERFNAATLADAFGGPGQQLEPLASGVRTASIRPASSPTQARYYRVQARKLDELKTMADGLNAACRIQREAGGSLAKGLENLNARTDWARGELRAAIIALNDAIDNQNPHLVVEAREEIERRERTLIECREQIESIGLLARCSGIELPDWIREEPYDERTGRTEQQRHGDRPDGRHILPNVRPDTADGTNGRDTGNVRGRDPVGEGEPRTQTESRRTGAREFDALIQESRTAIGESKALVDESDAQETTLRTQRDQRIARRRQEEGALLRRKGRTL